MIQMVTIDRKTGDGRYAEVLDVCEALGQGDYGSATNALAVMVWQSPLYRKTRDRLRPTPTNADPDKPCD